MWRGHQTAKSCSLAWPLEKCRSSTTRAILLWVYWYNSHINNNIQSSVPISTKSDKCCVVVIKIILQQHRLVLINSSWSVDFCLIRIRLVWTISNFFFFHLIPDENDDQLPHQHCWSRQHCWYPLVCWNWWLHWALLSLPCYLLWQWKVPDHALWKWWKWGDSKLKKIPLTRLDEHIHDDCFLIGQARCVLTHRWMWCVSSGIIAAVFLLWQDHSKPPTWRRKSTSSTSTHRLER